MIVSACTEGMSVPATAQVCHLYVAIHVRNEHHICLSFLQRNS